MIDLLSLTPENRRGIPKEDIRRLETGGWNLSDAWVLRCFGLMVSKHWREHLDQQGIVVSRVDGKVRLTVGLNRF